MNRNTIFSIAILLLLASALAADNLSSPFIFYNYYNGSGGYNGALINFTDAQSLAWGNGELYIGDANLQGFAVLDGDRVVSRVGGLGSTKDITSRPVGLFWTPLAIYIADSDKAGVIAYYGASTYSRVGPPMASGRIPSAVWVENNTLWMLDTASNSVVEYNLQTAYMTATYFSTGFGPGNLQNPQDIAMDSSRVYIADTGNNRIQVYDRNFNYIDTWGTGRGGVSVLAPKGVASDGTHLYVADSGNNRVVVFGPDGFPLQTLSGNPADGSTFSRPNKVRLGNNTLFVLDAGNNRVVAFGINWSNSQPALLADIDATNRSVQDHYINVIAVMDLLNVSHAPYTLPDQIGQAYAQTQASEYAQASSTLSSVRAALDAIRQGQIQALRAAIQARIDNDWSAVQYYQGVPMSDQQTYQTTVLTNRINDAQHQLNAEQYPGAAQVLLAVDADLPAYKQMMDVAMAGTANGTARLPPSLNPRQAVLTAQADALNASLESLKEQMARLRQNASLDVLQTLIDSGRTLSATGDYDNANASLTAAAAQLAQLQEAMDAQQQAVDNASLALDAAWKAVNASSAQWGVMGIDGKPILDTLAQAQDLLYSQPDRAAALAAQAQAAASLQTARAQTRETAVAWIGFAL
ncbi:MAG: NHL repeat-containing protein, partial [Candidatus Micrarchaeota archaeon]|nr:NHL repeat-containing protein [Candidatus Micrarchaeota archaeon]